MSLRIGTIGIIADDLTGANDTALQFLLRGCNTQILLDCEHMPESCHNTVAWAINTESRSLQPNEAIDRVNKAANALKYDLKVDFIYKKIDSTFRGNIAAETLALLENQGIDVALIVPAFPDEGRTTVGGYHLLRGIPIERTEVARDPNSPIYQSYIPAILANQCGDPDLIGHVTLNTVMRGAGPVLLEMQELIKKKKKLIVIDAVADIDLEQIVLAMEKCSKYHRILPCGSAGLAKALTKAWLPDGKYQHIVKTVPATASLIIVGSVTPITRTQIKLLSDHTEQFNLEFIYLTPEHLVNGICQNIVNKAINALNEGKSLVVYTSPLDTSVQDTLDLAITNDISHSKLVNMVLDRLAEFTKTVITNKVVKLVLVGGETAQKCCKAINSFHLQLIDEVDYAIPLCLDQNAQFIITKSGNLGSPKTLVNILDYIKNLEEQGKSKVVE